MTAIGFVLLLFATLSVAASVIYELTMPEWYKIIAGASLIIGTGLVGVGISIAIWQHMP